MPKTPLRIEIPTNADDLIILAKRLAAKHLADGAESPLKSIKGIGNLAALAATAEGRNEESKDLSRKAEKATAARETALGQSGVAKEGTVRFVVLAARDVLAGIHKASEHTLGDWGFTVDTSPRTAKKKKPQP